MSSERTPAEKNCQAGLVPELKNKNQYPLWKKRVEAWKLLTGQAPAKHALTLSLKIKDEHISQSLFNKMTVEDMNKDTGVKTLLKHLDNICMANTVEGVFTAIEKLETFQRKPGMTIISYLEEFERLKGLINEHMPLDENGQKKDCVDSVLAFRLMKQAKLPDSEELMIRAHVKELTTVEMVDVLKRVYGERIVAIGRSNSCGSSSSQISCQPDIEIKQEDVYHVNGNGEDYYYGNYYQRNNSRHRNSRYDHQKKLNERNNSGDSQSSDNQQRKNRFDRNTGKPSSCHNCGSILHWYKNCPESDLVNNDREYDFYDVGNRV